MMVFNVFGRTIGVKAAESGWKLYRVDLTENKHSPLRGYVIPPDVELNDLTQWLDDIFHEMATAENSEVKRLK
ncbi:hypothetical protein FS594_09845 [Rahnella aquatilis]|uniref:DUF7661 family protein n=1 Tax=Rahnella perminowiae TaxID=2816244 RepID=UPI001C25DCE3|nr:hypothetical protein [Rahnella perminowiae]MBU9824382.1 hypothetical protein [Rahnella perminowiae]UJD89071.1 hypothetical protein FS594_09845 [Rahnella aquatilis]